MAAERVMKEENPEISTSSRMTVPGMSMKEKYKLRKDFGKFLWQYIQNGSILRSKPARCWAKTF